MICGCGTKMKVVDTRHNLSNGERYRKYKCDTCSEIKYSVEDEVIANEQFIKEWRKYERKRIKGGKVSSPVLS